MNFQYRLVGLKELQKAVALAPGLMANRNAIALQESVELVKRVYIANNPTGPGHFGYHLVDKVRTMVRAAAGRSLQTLGYVIVGAPQARWREKGTKAHEIHPLRKVALWGPGLGFVSVVHHPGERARHTLRNALRDSKSTIRAYFVGATQLVAKSMATRGR